MIAPYVHIQLPSKKKEILYVPHQPMNALIASYLFMQVKAEELKGLLLNKKAHIRSLMEKTSEVRRMKDELQQNLTLV